MVTDALLEELRHRGEGSDLDYKAERYLFSKATDEEKSELLKDILALANTHREGTAHILIGFKENPPYPAVVVGIADEGAIDDSRIQEFVNGKLETKLVFRYEERVFDGHRIAVIAIPRQQRPFYLKKDYGKLTKDTVYVRRGTSTGIASPREIAMMGAAHLSRGEPAVRLFFQTPQNLPFPDTFEREFLNFPADLPDYVVEQRMPHYIRAEGTNRDYLRDRANYYSSWGRVIEVRISVENRSAFSLADVHIEITCRCPTGTSVALLRMDDMPDEPATSGLANIVRIPTMFEQAKRRMTVDDRSNEPISHIAVGTMRPGQSIRAEEDLAILPSAPGAFALVARILANEIPSPLTIEHPFKVSGTVTDASERQLYLMIADSIEKGDSI
jgi:hypothetical protein